MKATHRPKPAKAEKGYTMSGGLKGMKETKYSGAMKHSGGGKGGKKKSGY